MNKKILPKAIRPVGADIAGAGVAPAATKPAPMPPPRPAPAAVQARTAATMEATPSSVTDDARRARAVKLVEYFSSYAGVAGLIPVPFLDLAAISTLQFQMLRRLSHIYEVPFSAHRGKAVIAAVAGTMIPASSGIGFASLTKSVPIIGPAVNAFVVPSLAAGATFAIGMAFIKHFATGGTLLDFNPPDYREFLKAETGRRPSGATRGV
jgi:uncharacterized protein (DUF697 family)